MPAAYDVDSLHAAGLDKLQRGEFRVAADILEFAVEAGPAHAGAHAALGIALHHLGRSTEALASLRRAIYLDPRLAIAHNAIGLECLARGSFVEASTSFAAAIAAAPTIAVLHYHAGLALQRLGRVEVALASFDESVRLNADSAEAHNARGTALQQLGRAVEARKAYERAIALRPAFAEPFNNLGYSLRKSGRIEGALERYTQAIALKPDYADARWNRAVINLMTGRFLEGWEEYEWRWRVPTFPSARRHFAPPLWHGQPLDGTTILLHAEQGFGDTIQFVRYEPMVRARGGRVLLEVQPELVRLVKTLPGEPEVIARGEKLPPFDYHAPLLSLPRAFGTQLETVPCEVPYLAGDPADVAAWRERIPERGDLNVGIVWAGRPTHDNDRNRSLDPAAFAGLFRVKGASFFSLQVGRSGGLPASVVDLSPSLRDFADTAAAITCLDLVVTADTSVAHLAGALGKPVWVLIPSAPDWRWLLDRDDSPWYPSMRLFRQAKERDWPTVMTQVTRALRKLIRHDVGATDARAIESREAAF